MDDRNDDSKPQNEVRPLPEDTTQADETYIRKESYIAPEESDSPPPVPTTDLEINTDGDSGGEGGNNDN